MERRAAVVTGAEIAAEIAAMIDAVTDAAAVGRNPWTRMWVTLGTSDATIPGARPAPAHRPPSPDAKAPTLSGAPRLQIGALPMSSDLLIHDVIVIGSGPAGMSAALYAARANLDTKVIVGPQLGGQVSITYEIDNYLGIYEDLSGEDLTKRMVAHVEKFGAELIYDEVTGIELDGPVKTVRTYSGELRARAVVVSAGASATLLGVPGEVEFTGRGVSYCATCDGAFFKGHDVLVVGGGDSAMEEALFLTRFANTVRVIHRRDQLRAGPQLQERVFANPKIAFIWNTVIESIDGDRDVTRVHVRNVETNETSTLDATGVFVFIGHYPNSNLFKGILDMDEHGYLQIDDRMRTNLAGVYACGEIADPTWKQISTSVGQGAMAGMAVETWLGALESLPA